jgi:Tfp pilus assembly protein PilZ
VNTLPRKALVEAKVLVTQLLDIESRRSVWYYMDMEREAALGVLENRIHRLGDGVFVVCQSAKDFATLCLVWKGHLWNIPVDASPKGKGLNLKLVGVSKPKQFKNFFDLVTYYASKKQKGMPCRIDREGLGVDLAAHPPASDE